MDSNFLKKFICSDMGCVLLITIGLDPDSYLVKYYNSFESNSDYANSDFTVMASS